MKARRPPEFALRQLKNDAPRIVWLIRPPGESPQVLKILPLSPRRFLTYLLGISAPQRAVRGSGLLRRAGVAVPEVLSGPEIVFGREGSRIELRVSYVPGVSGWEVLQRVVQDPFADPRKLRAVARSLGRVVGCLIRNALFHRDLKIENFVIDAAGQVWIVDTDGVRPMRNRVREIERMLGRLAVQSQEAGIHIPFGVRFSLLREALRPLGREDRSAVIARLRDQFWVPGLHRLPMHPGRDPGRRIVPKTP
ncbi:protein kinase family protein [Thioalkalivibrio paradoxus]|uniref:Protein kinase domain-containing protein n=1 Tax=Thioalkalivibrio paradoxus ARh 1 TaxID=713585 RepID=W0DRW0_9GAMM|nr:hypothetical protein [Thioalkalivibrio paradoxus]AHF00013.1 hypothetical protein THITH_06500 [Thioalkalivibrio paradoxus ARh 1]